MPPAVKRVGYWMSEKKIRKLDIPSFCQQLRRENAIEMVLLDLDRPLAEQGPFSLIVHKLTDVMAAADEGDKWASLAVARVEEFLCLHQSLPVLDPLCAVRTLTDRSICYRLMRDCSCVLDGINICPPSFTTIMNDRVDVMAALRQTDISFPIVCKPLVAHGSDLAHKMAIIFNEEGLSDMQVPCVAQQFVNHNAVLYKVFVVGDSHYIVQRPSIKNFRAGDHETIFFDSHDVSKATSDSYLNQVDESLTPHQAPVPGCITALVRNIQQRLSLALFGVDVIIEMDSMQHFFIDINYFPGYDGVEDLFPALTRLIESRLELEEVSEKSLSIHSNPVLPHVSGTLHDVNTASIIPGAVGVELMALSTKTATRTGSDVLTNCPYCQTAQTSSINSHVCSRKTLPERLKPAPTPPLADVFRVVQGPCL